MSSDSLGPVEALVVGHICLDIIPELHGAIAFEPGKLVEAGPARLSTGGAVSNTGVSLVKLGVKSRLIGKIGSGVFGRAVLEVLESNAPGSSTAMRIDDQSGTSYTIVLSLSGQDRMFLHAPAANATFSATDVSDEAMSKAKLMHLGYPPLLARMYADDGKELVELFRRAKDNGLTTSLDLSLPDCDAPSGCADWQKILDRVLPYVDLFLPSVEELLYMLERRTFDMLRGAVYGQAPAKLIDRLVNQAFSMGAKCVGLKVGSRGFMLNLGSDLTDMGRGQPAWQPWAGQSLWHPCYKVDVVGTTGAGDATIAGFLMGVLHGFTPLQASQAAVAAGAYCCEQPDAISGVRSWEETLVRLQAGWETLPLELEPPWRQENLTWTRQAV